MNDRYTIGIDYGTESGRVLLVNIANGNEMATHVTPYRHGVMSNRLPDGRKLEKDWALQHPSDYLDVLYTSVPEVMRLSGVDANDVIGIGIDFTSCTILPIDKKEIPFVLMRSGKGTLTVG